MIKMTRIGLTALEAKIITAYRIDIHLNKVIFYLDKVTLKP